MHIHIVVGKVRRGLVGLNACS